MSAKSKTDVRLVPVEWLRENGTRSLCSDRIDLVGIKRAQVASAMRQP